MRTFTARTTSIAFGCYEFSVCFDTLLLPSYIITVKNRNSHVNNQIIVLMF